MQNITEPSVAVEEVIAIDAGKRTNVNIYILLLLFIIVQAMTGQSLSSLIIAFDVKGEVLSQYKTTLQIYNVPVKKFLQRDQKYNFEHFVRNEIKYPTQE